MFRNIPPYSNKFSKEAMIEFFEKQFVAQQDDYDDCEMDLDANENAVEEVKINPIVSKVKLRVSSFHFKVRPKIIFRVFFSSYRNFQFFTRVKKFHLWYQNHLVILIILIGAENRTFPFAAAYTQASRQADKGGKGTFHKS